MNTTPSTSGRWKQQLKPLGEGVVGAAVGGIIGYYVFHWLLSQGYYAPVLIGAVVGFAGSMRAREGLLLVGLASALIALGVQLYLEWTLSPQHAQGLPAFLTRLARQDHQTLLFLSVTAVLAFWIGKSPGFQRRR